MDLSDEKIVRSLVARHSLRLSKALGQNFLIDPSVCPRMAALCASPELSILEIGPGVGVLTKELAARAKKVVAVELDRRLKPVLDETLAGCGDIELVWGDILKLDLRALFDEHFAGTRAAVCANLPYYITSPALMRLLESRLPFETITLMLQKETAGRQPRVRRGHGRDRLLRRAGAPVRGRQELVSPRAERRQRGHPFECAKGPARIRRERGRVFPRGQSGVLTAPQNRAQLAVRGARTPESAGIRRALARGYP